MSGRCKEQQLQPCSSDTLCALKDCNRQVAKRSFPIGKFLGYGRIGNLRKTHGVFLTEAPCTPVGHQGKEKFPNWEFFRLWQDRQPAEKGGLFLMVTPCTPVGHQGSHQHDYCWCVRHFSWLKSLQVAVT